MATPATAFEYVCKVRDTGDGFISPVMAFVIEPGESKAIVLHAFIHAVHGAPMKVKVKDRGNGKYRVNYAVNNIPANPRPVRIGYRVDLDTVQGTVIVRGSMRGALNSLSGKGNCEEREFVAK